MDEPASTALTPVDQTERVSSVYGPVKSWRVGQSLGIDLLLQTSTCSFNCVYCQLGDIQLKTIERRIYVPTEQVERDLRLSRWEQADIITLSGSGEPTLALNLGEVIRMIKAYTGKPVMVLTNATLLHDPAVQDDLQQADIVAAKLDAISEAGLQQMNRPVHGVTFNGIIEGIKAFRALYTGKLCLQCMLMPTNVTMLDADIKTFIQIVQGIGPDQLQLNTPKRPYPLDWHLDSRGNHEMVDYPSRLLRTLDPEQASQLEQALKAHLTPNTQLVSVYQ
jgi:wyosine [tRNA(Phe)-imidazoG37] synthetase (radical SAM superfamily)